jgi:hypothetical protein
MSPTLQQHPANAGFVLPLSGSARVVFAELLLNPPRPNRKALAAAKRYKARLNSVH